MKGICKPKDTGVCCFGDYVSTAIIGVNSQQRWEFERLPSGRISLERDCIAIHMPFLVFEADWEIIKADRKEAAEA